MNSNVERLALIVGNWGRQTADVKVEPLRELRLRFIRSGQVLQVGGK